MTRTALTIVTALFTGFFAASSAQACISCEYVPEVVKASDAHAKRAKQKRLDVAAQARKAPAKQRIAKAEATAKRVAPKKVVETAAAEPVETKAETAQPATAETKTEPATVVTTETATTALAKKPVAVAVADATDGATTCMKFIPTIGKAIEVPCE
ncbi:MAG: hypothetical protein AB7S70_05180 [Hyphomicrobium sp.]|uniref:hypothetical protein n=1 Tax=Hyphomicrobium sp. TaxID=82 RepID=UPI003D12C341